MYFINRITDGLPCRFDSWNSWRFILRHRNGKLNKIHTSRYLFRAPARHTGDQSESPSKSRKGFEFDELLSFKYWTFSDAFRGILKAKLQNGNSTISSTPISTYANDLLRWQKVTSGLPTLTAISLHQHGHQSLYNWSLVTDNDNNLFILCKIQ